MAVNRALFSLWLLFPLVLLSGCLASLQTARTLPSGSYRVHAGAEYLPGSSSSPSGTSTTTGLGLDAGFRIGLGENLDFGTRFSFPGLSLAFPSALVDMKYQFIVSGGFVTSFNLGIDYALPVLGTSRAHLLSAMGALNFGYDFDDAFGTYLSARDLTPVILAAGSSSTTGVSGSTLGIALGIRIGDYVGVLAEGSYVITLSSGSGILMAGAAFFVGGGSAFRQPPEAAKRAETWKERQVEKGPKKRAPAFHRSVQAASLVLKVKAPDHLALLSQPQEGENWQVGENICLYQKTKSIACGTVTKSDRTGAVLHYSDSREPVTPGMSALSQVGTPPETEERTPKSEAPSEDALELEPELEGL